MTAGVKPVMMSDMAESGKLPWHADFLAWQVVNGTKLPARISITWQDQGEPWSYWDLEDIFWNVDISEALVHSDVNSDVNSTAVEFSTMQP